MIDIVGALSDGSVPCRFDTDVNAPALAEYLVRNFILLRRVSFEMHSSDLFLRTVCEDSVLPKMMQ